jgi:hypothetical protein
MNYLAPHLRTDPWTEPEDKLLVAKVNELGFAWSAISQFFQGRSDNDVKNRWYSHIRYVTAKKDNLMVFTENGTERKKRKRARACPQQSAWLILSAELQAGAACQEVKDVRDECFPEELMEEMIAGFWDLE